ncbi:hypothetical protein GCM10017557_33840 [Streptomyces aurantiacus]|uniref:Uncharacterized protein n=1 Tax=Streptomyces aurantiacus TaxID=47760 RepID=A0A7G1P641_9ACTN|nr:hypothetical protein GCM10017557_33840 [Streptomyces aurantiacus]
MVKSAQPTSARGRKPYVARATHRVHVPSGGIAVTIASRAASANDYVRQHSAHPLISRQKAADIARAAVRLAGLLGIDPVNVRPDRSWNYLSLPLAPLTLHASDPDDPQQVYTFSCRDPWYDDEPFFLLGPCPVCGAEVPLAEIRSLADVGAFLTHGPEPLPEHSAPPCSYPDAFDRHPAHTSQCPYYDGDS